MNSLDDLRRNPWPGRIATAGGIVLLSSLALCRGERGEVPTSPTQVDSIRKKETGKIRKIQKTPASQRDNPEEEDVVTLPTTGEGLVDMGQGGLLLPFEACVEGPGDTLCDNPTDPRSSRCISLRQGGAVPVWITTPYSDVPTAYMGEAAIYEDKELKVEVGGKTFTYPVNLSDPRVTSDQLTLACREVRKWLNTNWADLDRAVICEGVDPSSEDCDLYIDRLKRKGSGGYEMKQKSDALGALLEVESIDYFQTTPYMVDMDLLNAQGQKVGDLSVMVQQNADGVGYSVHSTLTGSDMNAPLLEKPEDALRKIQEATQHAASR